jgi:osmotically-inducible protein OsmY
MSNFGFRLGAQVYCKDRAYGKLNGIVVDQETGQITDLIVQTGLILRAYRVVPVDVVEKAAGRGVYVSIMSDTVDGFTDYCPAGKINRRGAPRGISAGHIVVDRRTDVRNQNGTEGKVRYILAERPSFKISQIMVDPGLFHRTRVIARSMIERILENAIYVKTASRDYQGLSVFIHRKDADILADVQRLISTLIPNLMAITIGVDGGIVQMIGVVPDEDIRSQAEEHVRTIDGVIAVENMLYTDSSVALRVRSALLADPRTEYEVAMGRIRVTCHQGTVTLDGTVLCPDAGVAAAPIAAKQLGVFSVLDLLTINRDAQPST